MFTKLLVIIMIYVSQIIMLYTLDVFRAICQLYLNKSGKRNKAYEKVYGTSFSCPLVAGFAACAWQASKGKTNMELFDLIQRSADLYPYCDYAFGYGVPQASYFTQSSNQATKQSTPTFRFERLSSTAVSVVFTCSDTNVNVFYKDIADDGSIISYGKRTLSYVDTTVSLDVKGGRHLVVFCNGYTADYRFEQPTTVEDRDKWVSVSSTEQGKRPRITDVLSRTPALDIPNESHTVWGGYAMLGLVAATADAELPSAVWSPAWRFGVRWQYRFCKAYSLGLALEYGHIAYRYNGFRVNPLEQSIEVGNLISNADRIDVRQLNTGEWSVELFQRVRFVPGGMFHNGFHWDLGAYLTRVTGNNYELTYRRFDDGVADSRSLQYNRLAALADYGWMYGVTTRLSYDFVGLYARYRLDGIGQQPAEGHISLPRLEVGVQLQF